MTSSTTEKATKQAQTDDDTSPDSFFRLVFLLSLPLYILTALAGWNILGFPELCPLYISLVTGVPCLAASILTTRQDGSRKRRQLFSKSFTFHQDKLSWYGLALLLGPLLATVSYGAVLLTSDNTNDIPDPMVPFSVVALVPILCVFIIMAAGEEVGWMGYAYEPLKLQYNNNASQVAFHLGVIWALWHVPFFFFLFPPPLSLTIPCQVITLLANRVLCVWLYQNTHGSVLAVILYHAADNVALVFFPDLKGSSPVTPCVTAVVAAVIVLFMYDSQTLTKLRYKN